MDSLQIIVAIAAGVAANVICALVKYFIGFKRSNKISRYTISGFKINFQIVKFVLYLPVLVISSLTVMTVKETVWTVFLVIYIGLSLFFVISAFSTLVKILKQAY